MQVSEPKGETVKLELTGDNLMETASLLPILQKAFRLTDNNDLTGLELVIDPVPDSDNCMIRTNGLGKKIPNTKEREVLGSYVGEEALAVWSGCFSQFLGHPNWQKQAPSRQNIPLPRTIIAQTLQNAVVQSK